MNITYLLGAGASWNSIYIVKEMNDHLIDFARTKLSIYESKMQNPYAFRQFKKELNKIADGVEKYTSVDEYANSVYKARGDSGLNELKIAYTIYLLLLQLADKEEMDIKRPYKEFDNPNRKALQNIDPRYIPFMNRLTQNEGLLENVNFLTWNYDIQLEKAFQEVLGLADIEESFVKLSSFPIPSQYKKEGMYGQINLPKIIHLNGTAGLFEKFQSKEEKKKGGELTFYNLLERTSSEKVEALLNVFLFIYDSNSQKKIEILESLNFAFEQGRDTPQQAVNLAKGIMEKTDMFVIIGYSLPFYNAPFDKILFNSLPESSKIVFVNFDNLTKKMRREYGVKQEIEFLDSPSDINEFYIPYE